MLAGIMDDHLITGGNLRKVTERTLPFANGVSNRLTHKDVKSNHGKSSKSWCVRVSGERTETFWNLRFHICAFEPFSSSRWKMAFTAQNPNNTYNLCKTLYCMERTVITQAPTFRTLWRREIGICQNCLRFICTKAGDVRPESGSAPSWHSIVSLRPPPAVQCSWFLEFPVTFL